MNVILPIPDELVETLSAAGADLSRRALEALAIEEYRAGRLTASQVGHLLGLETRDALDGFLKAHGEYMDYTINDLDRDVAEIERLLR